MSGKFLRPFTSRRRPTGSGTCGIEYHENRLKKRSLAYRLRRRTGEVTRAIRAHGPCPPKAILDIGTADGLMLSSLLRTFPGAKGAGVDLSPELLKAGGKQDILLAVADAAFLPFRKESFDLAVATAVIEHVPDPLKLLTEAASCLKPGGLLVLTSPAPFWEKMATAVGHLPDEQHHRVPDIPALVELCRSASFSVVETRKFMLSPVGMPLEEALESLLRAARLAFLLANQLVAARKSGT